MCTLIVGHRIDADTPLLVGANRDEALDRPASPPAIRTEGPVPVLAPRDDRAGGTWLGLNAAGLFAGLTNRFGARIDPDRSSRGEIVPRALEHETAADAAADLEELDPATYNGFHLVVADGGDAFTLVSDGAMQVVTPADPGFIVVTERSFGAADNPRKRKIRSELQEHRAEGTVELDGLGEILSRCESGSIDAVCIELEGIDYGTRSSTLIGRGGSSSDFFHADGPPCETDYRDLSDLVAALGR
jgi:uncharacterized protein with NRDE domain